MWSNELDQYIASRCGIAGFDIPSRTLRWISLSVTSSLIISVFETELSNLILLTSLALEFAECLEFTDISLLEIGLCNLTLLTNLTLHFRDCNSFTNTGELGQTFDLLDIAEEPQHRFSVLEGVHKCEWIGEFGKLDFVDGPRPDFCMAQGSRGHQCSRSSVEQPDIVDEPRVAFHGVMEVH